MNVFEVILDYTRAIASLLIFFKLKFMISEIQEKQSGYGRLIKT